MDKAEAFQIVEDSHGVWVKFEDPEEADGFDDFLVESDVERASVVFNGAAMSFFFTSRSPSEVLEICNQFTRHAHP
jgi:hypothetical protein